MKRFLPSCLTFAALACAPTPAGFAQTAAAPPVPAVSQFKPLLEKIDLQDGDTLVFLGDSITHQCLYTQYLEDFYYTRYPKLHLHFHNAGVGGDRAKDALTRFDEDVAAYKPKFVTILLGMNDGSYKDFDKAIFDTYQADMSALLEKIASLGATAVPMTPTMFDARAKRLRKDLQEPRNTYYNGVLALYGAWLREQAETRGLGFVDMFTPLNMITDQQRKKKPDWTMIPDGVHPGPIGQTIMAVAVAYDILPHSSVSQVVVAEKDGKYTGTSPNSTVTEVQKTADGVSFTLAANALPWVLPPDAAEGPGLAHLGHHFSNEKITVRSLPPGKYELKIDGIAVGQFNEGQLAFGVELEANDKTPQYQQALKVALLNKQRNDLAYHPLRDQYAQLKGRRRDLAKAEQGNDPQLEAKRKEFETWYASQKAKVAELLAKAKEYEGQIYGANQPIPRKYEVAAAR